MRNYTLLLILLFTYIPLSKSQDINRDGMLFFETSYMQYLPFKHSTPSGTKAITYTIESKNKATKYIKRFDENNQPISYHQVLENGEELLIYGMKYNEAGKMVEETVCSMKGKLLRIRTNTWNEQGEIQEIKVQNSKGQLTNRTTFEYGEGMFCPTRIVVYKKGGIDIMETWTHEYYEDCKRLKSTLRGKNNKTLREINYACHEEGESITPNRNETQVCTWDESSPDFLYKIYQTVNDKGRMQRTVQKLNRADSTLAELILYNADEEITFRQTYNNSYQLPLHSYSYHKGNVLYERVYTYQNDKIASYSQIKSGKQLSRMTYSYDELGRVTNFKTFDKNNKELSSIKVSYSLQ